MPIDFPCPSCGATLRVPDGSVGQQAQCPHCQATTPVLGDAAPSAPLAPSTPAASDNPYASPRSDEAPNYVGGTEEPPWECEGPSAGTFVETVKLVFGNSTQMFVNMRRDGGIQLPLLFGCVGSGIGALAGLFFQYAVQIVLQGLPTVIELVLVAIFVPVVIVVGMFIQAGVSHLMLMMLKGDNHGFETTFRVVAYVTGAVGLISAIPFLGGYIGSVVQIVFLIIGLMHAQQTTGLKATGAVLIPMAVCCCIGASGLAIVFFAAFASAGQF